MCVVKMPHTMPHTHSLTLIHTHNCIRYPSSLLTYLLWDKRQVDLYNPPTIHSTICTNSQGSQSFTHSLVHSLTCIHTHSFTQSLIHSCKHAVKRRKFLFVCFFIHWGSMSDWGLDPPLMCHLSWTWTWRGSCKILIVQPTNKLANNWSQTGRETGRMSGTAP